MVSKIFREDFERLEQKGIRLSLDEIVRLNALGLKIEKGERTTSLFALPRVAFISDDVVLREPTIGHSIWLDEVAKIMNMDDESTWVAVHVLALSIHDPDELPKMNKTDIYCKLLELRRSLSRFTLHQIHYALDYALHGVDQNEYEYAETNNDEDDEKYDESFSIGIGVLIQGVAISGNLSIGEAKKLTRSQLDNMIDIALRMKGVDAKQAKERATGDYYITLDAIEKRYAEVSNG